MNPSQRTAVVAWCAHAVRECAADSVRVDTVGQDVHVRFARGCELWREVVLGEHGGTLHDSDWQEP